MSETITGVEIPETSTVADATRFITEMTYPLLLHRSRRLFLTYGTITADLLEHFVTDLRRTCMVERVLASSWSV